MSEKSAAELNGYPSDFTLRATKRIDFTSSVNGRRYSILVALPGMPPPADGYPVLYTLDGEFQFASWAEAARFGAGPHVMIVGLGYPADPDWVQQRLDHFAPIPAWLKMATPQQQVAGLERWRDYTVGVSEEEIAMLGGAFGNMRASDTGGVEAFLQTIEADVKPLVYGLARVNKANQAIYGHSLGGQAAAYALLTEPAAFRTFIIGSPNLMWGKARLQAAEAAFAKLVEDGKATPRAIVTAGSLEGELPDTLPPEARAMYEPMILEGPVHGGRAFTQRLQALKGSPGYEIADIAVFDKLNHVSASWAGLARAFEFAFDPWIPEGFG